MKISIQPEDFSVENECNILRLANPECGALVTFSGLVRDLEQGRHVESLILEH